MAKKKKIRRRRRTTTLSAPRRRKSTSSGKKRRVRRRKKGMLSDFFTPETGQKSLRIIGSGAMGGGICSLIDRSTPNQTPLRKALIMAGGAVLAAAAKKPALAAGMAAVSTYIAVNQIPGFTLPGQMSDGWAKQMEALPKFVPMSDPYLLSQNNPFALSQDPQAAYLLSQMNNQGYMPSYVPMSSLNY